MLGASLSMLCSCTPRFTESLSEGLMSAARRPPKRSSELRPSSTRVPEMMLTAGFVRLRTGLLPIESMKPPSNR
jgi:hypothetical protein